MEDSYPDTVTLALLETEKLGRSPLTSVLCGILYRPNNFLQS